MSGIEGRGKCGADTRGIRAIGRTDGDAPDECPFWHAVLTRHCTVSHTMSSIPAITVQQCCMHLAMDSRLEAVRHF